MAFAVGGNDGRARKPEPGATLPARMVKILMRLPGNRISTSLPAAHASGFRQWVHPFGPLASGKESHSLCLGDFFPRENEERNLRAPLAGMPREQDHFRQALLFDGAMPPFQIGVQIRTPRRQF